MGAPVRACDRDPEPESSVLSPESRATISHENAVPIEKEHAVNDDQLKGKIKQGEGKAQEKWGDAKEKVDDLLDDLEDKTSRDPSDETDERPAKK
jgi:hypothetical protein